MSMRGLPNESPKGLAVRSPPVAEGRLAPVGKARKLSMSSTVRSGAPKGVIHELSSDESDSGALGDGGVSGNKPEEPESEVFSDSSDSSDLQEISPEDVVKDKIQDTANQNGSAESRKAEDSLVSVLPFTMADIQAVRTFLKVEGSMAFLDKYLPATASGEDIVRLTMLLGYYPVDVDDYNDEKNLVRVVKNLQKAMNRVLGMRNRLKGFNTLDQVVRKIQDSSRILVLTGAGISTSLGIPDFRSSKGFYSQLQHLGLSDPQEVFDLDFFREDPSIFYSIADMILPPENKYSPLHGFIKLLEDKGKLLRNYTQNIDNLEAAAGISSDKMIQCHGSFAKASCLTCRYQVPGNVIFPEIRNHELPICPHCAPKRKQLEQTDRLDNPAYGVMKPDITFFGEALPSVFHDTIKKDIKNCDLLICIGTSLKVAPVSEIVNKVPENIPQILINKDPVTHCEFDVALLGYCDQAATYLCRKLNWNLDHPDVPQIANSGLECRSIEEGSGVYEVTDAQQRKIAAQPLRHLPRQPSSDSD